MVFYKKTTGRSAGRNKVAGKTYWVPKSLVKQDSLMVLKSLPLRYLLTIKGESTTLSGGIRQVAP